MDFLDRPKGLNIKKNGIIMDFKRLQKINYECMEAFERAVYKNSTVYLSWKFLLGFGVWSVKRTCQKSDVFGDWWNLFLLQKNSKICLMEKSFHVEVIDRKKQYYFVWAWKQNVVSLKLIDKSIKFWS